MNRLGDSKQRHGLRGCAVASADDSGDDLSESPTRGKRICLTRHPDAGLLFWTSSLRYGRPYEPVLLKRAARNAALSSMGASTATPYRGQRTKADGLIVVVWN